MNLSGVESLKQTLIQHLSLSDLNLAIVFFNKEEEGSWPGHDERLNLSSNWTYPTWNLPGVISPRLYNLHLSWRNHHCRLRYKDTLMNGDCKLSA